MDLIPDNYERVNNDLIMGEQLNEAKEKGLTLQGLHYSEPEDIYSVSAMYLEISTKTYQESKVLGLAYSSSNNLSHSFYGSLNIIFIDAEYQVIRTLVDRKADIRSWEFAKPGIGFRNQIDASV